MAMAIRDGEIVPWYQPIMDVENGKVLGVEVLARWDHPKKRLILPSKFISMAESSGLIIPMTQSLLHQVSRDMDILTFRLPACTKITINITANKVVFDILSEALTNFHNSFRNSNILVVELTKRAGVQNNSSVI